MATPSASKWPLWLLALPSFYFIPRFDNLTTVSTMSAISAMASPLAVYYYIHEPTYVRRSSLMWAKLGAAACLIAFQIMKLMEHGHLQAMIDVVSAALIGTLVYKEHRHSIRPSSVLALFLIADLLGDVERSSLRSHNFGHFLYSCHAAAPVILKFMMLVLQSVPKDHLIIDEELRQHMQENAAESLFKGLFSALLNPLATGIYLPRAFMRNSNQLDPELHPELLLQQLKRRWAIQQLPEPGRPGNLFIACLKTWKHILVPLMIARLALTALKCAHPFVLIRIIKSVEQQYSEIDDGPRYYAAAAYGIAVFVGTAIAQEHFTHLMTCYTGRLRGGLIALQIDKLQRLTEADAKAFAPASLVSSDVDGIVDNIPNLLVIPISLVELGLGGSILSWFIDAPASIVCLPIILSSFMGYFIAKRMVPHFAKWKESTDRRTSSTSRVVQQLIGIKMLGLGPTICQFLQGLRVAEIQFLKPVGVFSALIAMVTIIADLGVPAAAIGAAMSADHFTNAMSAAKVFPLLSIIFSIHTSFPHIISSLSTIMSIAPSFDRIQKFLCLPERRDCRIAPSEMTAIDEVPGADDVICFDRADISPHRAAPVLLREVNFQLTRGSFTGVVGPHGTGKSTFIRAILGDCEVSAGSIQVNETDVGYCGEDVSLREGTIRENIIGSLPYNAERYNAVLRACFLEGDLTQLPGGDKHIVGAHGCNLSDGQRQRIGIARTLYPQHKIMLLDDVFRSLDIQTAICILHQLCGRNSILRQWGCTVVVATSLPDCLKVTDQLVLLDGIGYATLDRTYRTPAYRQRFVAALRTLNINNNALLVAEQRQQKTLYRYLQANGLPSTPQPCDGRTLSNWKLLMYAIRPIGRLRALIHAILVLMFSAAEVVPEIYLRYWIDFHAEDSSLYARYASLSLAASFISFIVYLRTFVVLSARISIELHRILVQTLGQSTLAYFELVHKGHLLNLFHDDTSIISRELPRAVFRIMYAGFATIIIIAVLLSGNKCIAVAFPVILLIIYLFIIRFCSSSRRDRQIDQQKRDTLCTFFEQTSAGLARLNSDSRRKRCLEEGMSILVAAQVSFYRKSVTMKMVRRAAEILVCGLVAMLLIPAILMKGTSTATSVALSYHIAVNLPRILYETILAFARLDLSLEAVQRFVDFEQQTPQETTQPLANLPSNWPSAGEIEVLHMSAYYSPAVGSAPALSDVSMFISPGRHVGVSGRSCSGKSTLVLMLLGFIRYQGSSKIDGIEISSIAPEVLRSHLITITREPIILEGTVRQNLLPLTLNEGEKQWRYAEDDRKDAELELLLKRLHLWVPLLAKGRLDAIVDDVNYSKGDLQLLCIARAIMRQRETGRRVILIDDATSELNMEKETLANEIIAEYLAGCTVLRTSSRPSALDNTDAIAYLHRGQRVMDPSQIHDESGSDGEAQE
ncbi:hypothetical protein PWT90_02510 [Aphanocladium album]|nr:hypothetical protein PWT90_02510 [Aphanocladium album]